MPLFGQKYGVDSGHLSWGLRLWFFPVLSCEVHGLHTYRAASEEYTKQNPFLQRLAAQVRFRSGGGAPVGA